MLDGIILNTTLENSSIPTTFSFFTEQGLDRLIHSSIDRLSSLGSEPEISSLIERIVVNTAARSTFPSLFESFANWMNRLQIDRAIGDDFDGAVEDDRLLTRARTRLHPDVGELLPSKQVGVALTSISTGDRLLNYPS